MIQRVMGISLVYMVVTSFIVYALYKTNNLTLLIVSATIIGQLITLHRIHNTIPTKNKQP